MAINGLHVPHGEDPIVPVTVNERNVTSYYPYVQRGPVEAGHLKLLDEDVILYVNSRYSDFEPSMVNARATAIFQMGGVGVAGGWVLGDALLVRAPGRGSFERSLPDWMIEHLLAADSGPGD